jgi:hypothetical protein
MALTDTFKEPPKIRHRFDPDFICGLCVICFCGDPDHPIHQPPYGEHYRPPLTTLDFFG